MSTGAMRSDRLYAFFALACAITWLLATPMDLAWWRQVAPPPYAVAGAGLSALGPLFAVLLVARGQLREVFGRWRASPLWILFGLLLAPAVHLAATALFVAIGGRPVEWFHPPVTSEHVAALIVFSLGEEFGWRGFAHPRAARRYGLVRGTLLVGVAWGVWHLFYSVSPVTGRLDVLALFQNLVTVPLYAFPIAWLFERSNRSMAVAIACHAGGHLDQIGRAPRDLRLHALHVAVLAVVAALAARSLARDDVSRS